MCPKYVFTPDDITELTADTDLTGFCCDAGNDDDPSEVNDYIHNYSKPHLEKKLSKTYLFHQKGELVGVISMSMGSIRLAELSKGEVDDLGDLPFKQIPVLLLGQIGTHVDHRKCGVCREMCDFGVTMASRLSKEVGCRYVALAAETKKNIEIYTKIGFSRKTTNKKRVIMAQRI